MVEKDSRGEQLPIGETLQNSTPDAATKGKSGVCPSAPEVLPPHMRVIWFELKVIVVLTILILVCWKKHIRIISALHARAGPATNNTWR